MLKQVDIKNNIIEYNIEYIIQYYIDSFLKWR